MMSSDVQGDDEFRSHITDFESFLHNIGGEARTASPEVGLSETMTTSYQNYEQNDGNHEWHKQDADDDAKDDGQDSNYEYNCYGRTIEGNVEEQDNQHELGFDQQLACSEPNDSADLYYEHDSNAAYRQKYSEVDEQTTGIYEAQDCDYSRANLVDTLDDITGESNHVLNADVPHRNDGYYNDCEEAVEQCQTQTDGNETNTEHHIYGTEIDDQYCSDQQQQQEEPSEIINNAADDYNAQKEAENYAYNSENTYYDDEQSSYHRDTNYDNEVDSAVHHQSEEQQITNYNDSYNYNNESTDYYHNAAEVNGYHHEEQQYVEQNQTESETKTGNEVMRHEEDHYEPRCHDDIQYQSDDRCRQVKFSVDEPLLQDSRPEYEHDDSTRRLQSPSSEDGELDQQNQPVVAERGRIKVLLAQWRQFEQERGEKRSNRNPHTRSRSCGPISRRQQLVNAFENRCNDDTATERNNSGRRSRWGNDDDEEDNTTINRAAILAKFENLEAQAHKTAIVTRKKEYKWSVKEPITLGKPVGIRLAS